jgi:hypothetical protein
MRQLLESDLLQDGEESLSMTFGEMGCEVIATSDVELLFQTPDL